MNFELLNSEKNRPMLQDLGGYLYWKILSRGNRTYWRCTFFQTGWDGTTNTKCGGKGLSCNQKFELTIAHNHYGDDNRIEAKRFQGIIQKQALSSKELPRRIIGGALKEISKEAWGHIRRSFAANNIRKIRQGNNLEPANPKNLQSLVVPKDFQVYQDEIFLKFDGWNGAERVLIFATDKCLDLLVAEKNIGADGTWGVVPLLFDNLWIIYARLAHTFVPVVFSLLTDRKKETYEFVLKKLVELRPDLLPSTIAVDFELGEFNAFKKIWPEIQMRGCFVHLQRSMIRNVYEKGNKSLYDSNSMFRLEVNMILALAFVPVDDVGVALDDLRTKVEGYQHRKELEPLIDYFEDNYVGRPLARGKRRDPRYALNTWNVRALVENNEPKTSNGIESFNGQMIRTMAAHHPTIWKLIEGLQLEFALSEQRVAAFWMGVKMRDRRIAYRHLNERLKNLVDRYAQIPDKVEFLKGVASNIGCVLSKYQAKKRKTGETLDKYGKKVKKLIPVITLDDTFDDFEADSLDEICADDFGIIITERIMQCLQPKQWLNGDVISFYLQLLVQRSINDLTLPKMYAFDSFFYPELAKKGPKDVLHWTTNVDLFEHELLLIPIHTTAHWSLAAVNILTRQLYFYDSLHGDAENHLNLLKSFLHEFAMERGYHEENPTEWISFCPKDTPVQTNTFDCGAFVCKFAECLSSEVPMNFSLEEMPMIRSEVEKGIRSGSI